MVPILKRKSFVWGILAASAVFATLGAVSGNIHWTQLLSADRHGNGTKGQASDGTGTSGNLAKYDAAGNVTDSGIATGSIGTGTVTHTGSLTSGQLVTGNGSADETVGNLSGDVTTSGSTATTIANNAVTAGKSAVVLTRRTCSLVIGADNASSALADADLGPQGRQCFVPYAATVVEVTVAADGGTPNIIPRKNHAGSNSDLVSSALATASSGGLACSNAAGTTGLDGATTCSSTLQNTSLAAGDWIGLTSGTAGGTAKRMSIAITWTVN